MRVFLIIISAVVIFLAIVFVGNYLEKNSAHAPQNLNDDRKQSTGNIKQSEENDLSGTYENIIDKGRIIITKLSENEYSLKPEDNHSLVLGFRTANILTGKISANINGHPEDVPYTCEFNSSYDTIFLRTAAMSMTCSKIK